jgi:hypothetical protein
MITYRPACNPPGAKIEHDLQVEPAVIGWQIGDKCEASGVEYKTTIASHRLHSSHNT